MAVAYIGAGSTAVGTTSVAPNYPASGIQAGDLLIMAIVSKYAAAPPTTPAGWTLLGTATGGSGANGADSGSVFVSIYRKDGDATGSETGSVSVTVTGGNSQIGTIFNIRRDYGTDFVVNVYSGADSSAGTAYAVSISCDELRPTDLLLMITGINSNLYTTSSPVVNVPGIGTNITARIDSGTAQGDNTRLVAHDVSMSAGHYNGTGVSWSTTMSGTAGSAPAGVTVMLRIAEKGLKVKTHSRGAVLVLGKNKFKRRMPDYDELMERNRRRRGD